MANRNIFTLLGALVFLLVACLSLYRLVVGFPITIGGMEVGQVSTFFVFVISAVLAVMLFRGPKSGG